MDNIYIEYTWPLCLAIKNKTSIHSFFKILSSKLQPATTYLNSCGLFPHPNPPL